MGTNNSVRRLHLDQGATLAKKYKAIIFDVDGTLIPKKREGMPSQKIIDAIAKARQIIHVGVATSRPLFYLSSILDKIEFSGPSIINGGAQIVDFPSREILWEKPLEQKDIEIMCKALKRLPNNTLYLNNGSEDIKYNGKHIPKGLMQVYIAGFALDEANKVVDALSNISSAVAIHKVPSWQEGKTDIIATHASATKQHGIFEIARILGIGTHEIIAVGDGYNDFPLLMACGLKVAMGNAIPDLKAIADYVAPSVEEDGVADVIDKFVLSNTERSSY